MTPAARVAAVIDVLGIMKSAADAGEAVGRQAGQWLRADLQRRRYAGSGDRAAIGSLFWLVQRCQARLGWHLGEAGAAVEPRLLVLAALVLIERRHGSLSQLFNDDLAHAPSALSKTELALAETLASAVLDDPRMPLHVRCEWPEWLVEDAAAGLGDRLEVELRALTDEAPTDVRINPLRQPDRRLLRDRLAGRGLKGHPTLLSPLGVRLEKRARLEDLPEWKAGLFDVQDQGAQVSALLCDARPGMQVADVCSGAAGKALVMAAAMNNKGRILALDTNGERLEKGGARLRRAAIHNVERKLVAEKWSSRNWRGKFDRVVVDAPCSGSGTWRRQVDARWRLVPDMLATRLETQAVLLDKARAMVAPGGRIIYITCSVLASEGQKQVQRLLDEAPELELADIAEIWADTIGKAGGGACPPTKNNMLQLLPARDGTDGFFLAVLQARLR
jgi:16S rRNA (cytosine967-C5)-methyltransferase